MNAAAKRPPRGESSLSPADTARRLPLVRVIIGDIVNLHRDLEDRRERLSQIRRARGGSTKRHDESVYTEELRQVEDDIATDDRTFRGYIAELTALGGQLVDPAAGRVEFAGEYQGRPVIFGWMPGHDDLTDWRPAGGEPAERRPLLESSASD